jgi:alkanesulfonate monooxygenase SsuD/methylene tetrahydromethanopterin reductase-like flavin-dependent oxidoreductase (luciferase family)
VYRSVGLTTSTAVIWFMVRVPVLSELMAEVNPSVSTDGRSFTIALRLARSTPPIDRMVWVTVGSASGMAAMASDTAATNR